MARLGLDWAELQSCWEEVRDSGFLTEGKFTRQLEEDVAEIHGMHAVAFSSAGAGLYSMCRVLNVKQQVVVAQNNTFYATGAMPQEAGAQVHLVDVRKDDFSMACAGLGQSPLGVSVVVLTHVGGGLARDYGAIESWCTKHNAILLEDAAHALGARGVLIRGSVRTPVTAGSLSQGAVFSLYATKAVPVGEGGLVVTRDEAFARALSEYRNYGKHVMDGVVHYRQQGFNFRMDEWSAAVAYLQVKRLPEIMERRNLAADALRRVIAPVIDYGGDCVSNWYKYPTSPHAAAELGVTRFTGKVFCATDQLRQSMRLCPGRQFPNSDWVDQHHVCLPIEEDLYHGWSKDQIIGYLRGEGAR